MLGLNMTLSVGGVTIGKAKNVDLDLKKNFADVSVRDGGGWEAKEPALKGWSVNVEQLYVPSNAGVKAIMAAWMNDTLVAVVLTDEDGYTHTGNAYVGSLKRGEPLGDAVTLSCDLQGTGALVDTVPDS